MGYVAVRGGGRAIERSLDLLELERLSQPQAASANELLGAVPELVEQVMGEASLYAPQLAATALKQANGSPEEAVFLLRALRSTLERPNVSRVIDTADMHVRRRISATFKDVPGGQLLGATRDYSHRLVRFELADETPELQRERAWQLQRELAGALERESAEPTGRDTDLDHMPRVLDYLRDEGLLARHEDDDAEPLDVTMEQLTFPAPRSARLQTLARGMTQGVMTLGYAAVRGFGDAHPTVGELRAGAVEVLVDAPFGSGGEGDAYYLGSIVLTEVETVFTHASHEGPESYGFELGYGLVMGRLESKAIAMSVLDYTLEHGEGGFPTEDEEFVLYHLDGVEATGFLSHFKLPHYVTFQSKLSTVRSARERGERS